MAAEHNLPRRPLRSSRQSMAPLWSVSISRKTSRSSIFSCTHNTSTSINVVEPSSRERGPRAAADQMRQDIPRDKCLVLTSFMRGCFVVTMMATMIRKKKIKNKNLNARIPRTWAESLEDSMALDTRRMLSRGTTPPSDGRVVRAMGRMLLRLIGNVWKK